MVANRRGKKICPAQVDVMLRVYKLSGCQAGLRIIFCEDIKKNTKVSIVGRISDIKVYFRSNSQCIF